MTDIQQIVNYYLKLKNLDNKDKEFYAQNGIKYSRFVRPAKRLLVKCRGDIQLAKDKLWNMKRWANDNNLNWEIETVLKRWNEDSGRAEEEIKSLEIAEQRSKDSFTSEQLKENLRKLEQIKLSFGTGGQR